MMHMKLEEYAPGEIEKRSFAIIEEELGAGAGPGTEAYHKKSDPYHRGFQLCGYPFFLGRSGGGRA